MEQEEIKSKSAIYALELNIAPDGEEPIWDFEISSESLQELIAEAGGILDYEGHQISGYDDFDSRIVKCIPVEIVFQRKKNDPVEMTRYEQETKED